jgi:hypothetical protein
MPPGSGPSSWSGELGEVKAGFVPVRESDNHAGMFVRGLNVGIQPKLRPVRQVISGLAWCFTGLAA